MTPWKPTPIPTPPVRWLIVLRNVLVILAAIAALAWLAYVWGLRWSDVKDIRWGA